MIRGFLTLLVAGVALLAFAYHQATADPVVRTARVALLPPGTPPLRLVLLSDVHVGGPDMPPARLARIVGQVNALHPDLVLIAGDFVSDKRMATNRYIEAEMAAPLRGLRSALGTIAVLGNHDHWRNAAAMRAALAGVGIAVLANQAVRAGPLVIGGVDDDFTHHADLPRTLAAIRRLGGVPVLLSHSPDIFPAAPGVGLTLAGHTHCGQIRLPLIGALSTNSRYGDRYACGLVREGARTLVGAGLGTSVVPLRLGAVPDLWLVTLTA